MEYKTIWDWLGIERTTDKEKIKKAFSEQSKVYHPEEHPEEFQMLKKAYQTAIKQLKKQEKVVELQDVLEAEKNDTHIVMADQVQDESEKILNSYFKVDQEEKQGTQEEKQEPKELEQSDQTLEQEEANSKKKLNFGQVFQKLQLQYEERDLSEIFNQIKKLCFYDWKKNDVALWKEIIEGNSKYEYYNELEFTKIIEFVLLQEGLSAQVLSYILQQAMLVMGDMQYSQVVIYLSDQLEMKQKEEFYAEQKNRIHESTKAKEKKKQRFYKGYIGIRIVGLVVIIISLIVSMCLRGCDTSAEQEATYSHSVTVPYLSPYEGR